MRLTHGRDRMSPPPSSGGSNANEMQLAGHHGVSLERRSAHRREVLDNPAVPVAERDELTIDDGPRGASASGSSNETDTIPTLMPPLDLNG